MRFSRPVQNRSRTYSLIILTRGFWGCLSQNSTELSRLKLLILAAQKSTISFRGGLPSQFQSDHGLGLLAPFPTGYADYGTFQHSRLCPNPPVKTLGLDTSGVKHSTSAPSFFQPFGSAPPSGNPLGRHLPKSLTIPVIATTRPEMKVPRSIVDQSIQTMPPYNSQLTFHLSKA